MKNRLSARDAVRGGAFVCSALLSLGCSAPEGAPLGGGTIVTTPGGDPRPYTFRAGEAGFEISVDGEDFEDFWPIGVNYSHAIPGTSPGEFLAERSQIAGWIEAISDLGGNSLRVYTVQSPLFYEELRRHNVDHPDRPLFLLQGAWLKEPVEDPAFAGVPDYFDPAIRGFFRDEIEKVVDVVHGSREILPGSPENPLNWGRAFGSYTADVSPWLLGWLIGREVEPITIMSTHEKYYADHCGGNVCPVDFEGGWLSIHGATPMEAFVTEHLDYITAYEDERWGERHTLGFSNWPTLDPIDHPAEPSFPDSADDTEELDLLKVEIADRFEHGLFFSYHAYPYYPEFIVQSPELQVNDDEGPNSYLGYLEQLRKHYAGRTLLIAEIGHPSSQGSAHYTKSGLNHGDLDEVEQGEAINRSLRTLTSAGMDGAFLFEIIDEWFKRAWVVDRLELPVANRNLWYNTMSPEQNFGLVAIRPGTAEDHHVIDGLGADFDLPPAASQEGPALAPLGSADGPRTLRSLTLDSDEGYLHLLLRVDSLDPDGDGKVDFGAVDWLFGFDTYLPEKGDSCLAPGCTLIAERRVEFVLQVHSDEDVTLWVDRPYDVYGVWHQMREPYQLYHTEANDDGLFEIVRSKTNNSFWYDGQQLGEAIIQETGRFRTGPEPEYSNSNFWYSIAENTLEIRIPWNLLNVTDPSHRWVVDDHVPGTKTASVELEISKTPEIAVVVAALGGAGEVETALVDTLPRAIPKNGAWVVPSTGTATYTWAEWDANPRYYEVRKRSFGIVKDALPTIVPSSARHQR
jgi:hypothetical protein